MVDDLKRDAQMDGSSLWKSLASVTCNVHRVQSRYQRWQSVKRTCDELKREQQQTDAMILASNVNTALQLVHSAENAVMQQPNDAQLIATRDEARMEGLQQLCATQDE